MQYQNMNATSKKIKEQQKYVRFHTLDSKIQNEQKKFYNIVEDGQLK